ncbi:macro domain-containing protein [Streptomyces sp. CBMA29]|uniref:macro domain-containing protein n=1 Tax=Streptomyces sp. CBMA29 TaxID=1896314 RepID=UPI001661C6C6|nr:hypothetical protein [Streptomyces sp. CBMA29]MBD0737663.1 hypothetical protein [Streptomyces sp. CBMA29]
MTTSLPPDHSQLLEEIRIVRRIGLVRLRGHHLPLLEASAAAFSESARMKEVGVEALLRRAVSLLDGTLRTAAEYTLGLAQGTRDWAASSRRSEAASVYRVSVERFRKDHEVMVLGQVAERVIQLVTVRAAEETEKTRAPAEGGEPPTFTHRIVRVFVQGREVALTVHMHPVDLLRNVDVLVSPANVHLAMPEAYKSSIPASLRRGASVRSVTGEVLHDPVHDELREWAARHGTSRLPVVPGTVVATGVGALADQGIRRIYHAAIAVPRAGTNNYDVLPADITRAVSRTFALLAEESSGSTPPLRSVCFPLLGSGRGGLPYHISLRAVWAAIEAELALGATCDVHFVVRTAEAAALLERLPTGIRPERGPTTTG